jgi:hypothetical protein
MSVKLRRKKLRTGGYSLFLDIYNRGQRQLEFLDFKLKGGKEDKELWEMAKTLRAKRELELATDTYDMQSFKKSVVEYFEFADAHLRKWTPSRRWCPLHHVFCHSVRVRNDKNRSASVRAQ